MEKKHFSSLSQIEKIDFVWNYGEIITEIETDNSYDSLFILHGFFVEVHLDKSTNEIISIFVQEDTEALFKFVKSIHLNELQAR